MKTRHPIHSAMAEGEMFIKRGKLAKARTALQRVLKIDDEYEPAILRLAYVALKEGNAELAAGYFQKVGELALKKNLNTKALGAYSRALECSPANRTLLEMVKGIYTDLGRHHAAERVEQKFSPPQQATEKAEQHVKKEETEPAQEIVADEQLSSVEKLQLNFVDMRDEDLDTIAEIELLIGEGTFEQAALLLDSLRKKYSDNKYLEELGELIHARNRTTSTRPIEQSPAEPEIDLTGAIQ